MPHHKLHDTRRRPHGRRRQYNSRSTRRRQINSIHRPPGKRRQRKSPGTTRRTNSKHKLLQTTRSWNKIQNNLGQNNSTKFQRKQRRNRPRNSTTRRILRQASITNQLQRIHRSSSGNPKQQHSLRRDIKTRQL